MLALLCDLKLFIIALVFTFIQHNVPIVSSSLQFYDNMHWGELCELKDTTVKINSLFGLY